MRSKGKDARGVEKDELGLVLVNFLELRRAQLKDYSAIELSEWTLSEPSVWGPSYAGKRCITMSVLRKTHSHSMVFAFFQPKSQKKNSPGP